MNLIGDTVGICFPFVDFSLAFSGLLLPSDSFRYQYKADIMNNDSNVDRKAAIDGIPNLTFLRYISK